MPGCGTFRTFRPNPINDGLLQEWTFARPRNRQNPSALAGSFAIDDELRTGLTNMEAGHDLHPRAFIHSLATGQPLLEAAGTCINAFLTGHDELAPAGGRELQGLDGRMVAIAPGKRGVPDARGRMRNKP